MLTRRQLVGAAVLLIAARLSYFVHLTGELRTLHDFASGCKRHLADEIGHEDFAEFDGGGLISIGSDHSHFSFKSGVSMRQMLAAGGAAAGHHPVHARVLRGGRWRPLELTGRPGDFAPHGLAGWSRLGSKGSLLLVVNHRTTHDTLEIFSLRGGAARHVRSLSHRLLFNINDCAFATADLVYCTNWRHFETGGVFDFIEVYTQRPWSYVVACGVSSGECTTAASGLKMANGIAVRNGVVFVVESMGPHLIAYRRARDTLDLRLEFAYRIHTRSLCDNLAFDGDGLLSGCHPRALTFAAYSKAPRELLAPCEVLRFHDVLNASRMESGATLSLSESATVLYRDAVGEEFSACTIAARRRGVLWIGAVHDKGILACKA